jgi:hypothetical protein
MYTTICVVDSSIKFNRKPLHSFGDEVWGRTGKLSSSYVLYACNAQKCIKRNLVLVSSSPNVCRGTWTVSHAEEKTKEVGFLP